MSDYEFNFGPDSESSEDGLGCLCEVLDPWSQFSLIVQATCDMFENGEWVACMPPDGHPWRDLRVVKAGFPLPKGHEVMTAPEWRQRLAAALVAGL